MWKNKFGCSKNKPQDIDGLSDDKSIADKFATVFSAESVIDVRVRDNAKVVLLERLEMYEGSNIDVHAITVEMVDKIIADLKCGKAAGIDGLTSEHLKFAWEF